MQTSHAIKWLKKGGKKHNITLRAFEVLNNGETSPLQSTIEDHDVNGPDADADERYTGEPISPGQTMEINNNYNISFWLWV